MRRLIGSNPCVHVRQYKRLLFARQNRFRGPSSGGDNMHLVGQSGIYFYSSGMKWEADFFFFADSSLTHENFYVYRRIPSHTFDSKNRISLPSKFRKELGASGRYDARSRPMSLRLSKGSVEKAGGKSLYIPLVLLRARGLSRLMLAGAVEADVDSAGRILVRTICVHSLPQEKSVVAGVNDRIEVWDEKAWATYTKAIRRDADEFAERLGTAGAL